MNPTKSPLFTEVISPNGKFTVRIGRPNNDKANLFTSFNPLACTAFIDALDALPYLRVLRAMSYDDVQDELGGMVVQFLEPKCLSRFIEELPELVYEYVEKAEI